MHRPRSQLRSIRSALALAPSRLFSSYRVPRAQLVPRISPSSTASLKHKCLPTWIGKCLPTRVTYRHTCGALSSRFLSSPFPLPPHCLSFSVFFSLLALVPVPPARAIHVPQCTVRVSAGSERAARNRCLQLPLRNILLKGALRL